MRFLVLISLALLSGCAQFGVQTTEYPNPASLTVANVPVNRCLHYGECDNRPYPVAAYARGLDPRWAGDADSGVESPGYYGSN